VARLELVELASIAIMLTGPRRSILRRAVMASSALSVRWVAVATTGSG
jgi:hypothetical protein